MRLLLESFRLGLESIRAHKLRSGLTLLGHVMGIVTVVTLISLIQGLNYYVSDKILVQGANFFYVDKVGLAMNEEDFLKRIRRPDLSLEAFEAVRDRSETLNGVGALLQTQARVRYEARSMPRAGILGVTPDSPILDPYPVVAGRDLREDDLRHRRSVALIGDKVREELFGRVEAVGRTIRIGSRRYEVVGVLGKRGNILGQSTDDVVMIPITELLTWQTDRSFLSLIAQPREDVPTVDAQDEVRWILRSVRGLRPRDADDFEIYSTDALLALYQGFTGGLFFVLVGVGGISLVVGGIVIMNIMLVSVTERTREIGVRLSVGARRRDILQQFLIESTVLTVAGGAIGLGFGFLLALAVGRVSPLPARLSVDAATLAIGVSAVVGLVFGLFPAWRAARLNPVAALRYE